MQWVPNFSYQKNRDSDDAFKFMKKKGAKKGVGPLGKRLDQEIKGMAKIIKPMT